MSDVSLDQWVQDAKRARGGDRLALVRDRMMLLRAGEIEQLNPGSWSDKPGLENVAWMLGHDYWQERIRADPRSDTCWAAAEWFCARKLSYEWFVSYPADFAWYTRDDELLRPDPTTGLRPQDAILRDRDPAKDATVESQPAAMVALIGAMRLRFQERYVDLAELMKECAEYWGDDPMFSALRGLALLGRGDQVTTPIEHALAHPQCTGRIEHVCLHAYRAGDCLPNQGQLIVALANRMIDQDDLNLHWRRAYGYRQLSNWAAATRDIEQAFNKLTRHHDLRQVDELIRERELIASMSSFDRQLSKALEGAIDQFRFEAQTQSRETLTRVVEIVGIFTALVTFVLTGTQLSTSEAGKSTGEAAALLALVGAGLLGFIALLLLVTRVVRK
jgi:hypothetical protein